MEPSVSQLEHRPSVGRLYPIVHTCNLQEVKLLPVGWAVTNVSMVGPTVMGLARVTWLDRKTPLSNFT